MEMSENDKLILKAMRIHLRKAAMENVAYVGIGSEFRNEHGHADDQHTKDLSWRAICDVQDELLAENRKEL